MRKHYLTAILCVVLGLTACKKNNTSPTNAIVGKWYESKLTIEQNNGTATVHDTTFTGDAFTSADYFQFDKDNSATFSQSGVYTITGKGKAISGGTIDISVMRYTYKISDSTLALTPALLHPTNGSGGDGIERIVQLDATHLVLRTSFYSPGPYGLTQTAYFTKEN